MNAKFAVSILLFVFVHAIGRAQIDPRDPLGSAFRISQRSMVRAKLPARACAVFFSGGFKSQAEGMTEPRAFNSESNFHYLTGLNVPDAVLVILQAPMPLAEGQVSEILFLPDNHDQVLKLMGEDYKGKFALHSGNLAIRPATQFRKFCIEILAQEEMQTVFAYPFSISDYRKRGELAYTDLGEIFFTNLAPGFPFDPAAQYYYREIMRADTAAMRQLGQRVNAYLSYYPSVRRDAILNAFSQARMPGDLYGVQAQIKAIKIDLIGLQEIMTQARLRKMDAELPMMEKACLLAMKALDFASFGKPAGRTERQIQAAAEYYVRFKGGETPNMTRVSAGANVALPYYNRCDDTIPAKGNVVVDVVATWNHYNGRITRTLPAQGRFEGKDLELYSALRQVHMAAIQSCKPGTRPSAVMNGVQADFDDAVKRLDISSTPGKGVLRVFDLSPIGLEVNEFSSPQSLEPGMTLVVETAVYVQGESAVKQEWRNKAAVLRDVVLITENGNRVLTSGFVTDPGGIEALLNRIGKLPLE